MRQRIADAAELTTWSELSEWALSLFHDFYGDAADLGRLPAEEQYAAAAIDRILRGLSGLDAFGIAASRERLHDLLQLELEATLPRVGRFGEGVFVGPISAAIGLDADIVFVLGLAEDAYPGRIREDALLGADVRDRVDELPDAGDRLDAQRRHLLAAFSAAPRVVASFPRGDLRRSTERLPSRWLLPTLRALTGRGDLVAVGWDRHPAADVIAVRSHASELLTTPRPATEQEWRTRAISAGLTVVDPVTEIAELVITARASANFTRFDGNLAGVAGLPDFSTTERRISPTALETYATCPHSYFVGRLLYVEPLEQPEDIITISAMDIGNLVHASMDDFIRDQADALPSYGEPWTDAQRRRLQEIAAARADDFEAGGATGHPLLWEHERVAVLADLNNMLSDDNAWRRERDARVVASELTFGMRGAAPVAIDVAARPGADGRQRRQDRRDPGRRAAGHRYQDRQRTTGSRCSKMIRSRPAPSSSCPSTPTPRANCSTRPRSRPSTGSSGRTAASGSRFRSTTSWRPRYASTIGILVDSIAAGRFPLKAPEDPDFSWVQCHYCNPDGLGHSAERERWERKRSDPALAPLLALIEPDSAASGGDPE